MKHCVQVRLQLYVTFITHVCIRYFHYYYSVILGSFCCSYVTPYNHWRNGVDYANYLRVYLNL